MRRDPRKIASALDALRQRFGDRLTSAAAICERHGQDESWHPGHAPDAVLFAETLEDIVDAVRLCGARDCPIIPYGTGTSLEGHVAALSGGISLDLSRMNRVLRVSAADLDCTVEAGVTRGGLNRHLRDTGLFFPIDPGADASIGGMAATRASGTNAVRYGTMRENVLGLTVVLADGEIVRCGTRARKSSAGYDLTRLFVGSEGTLGIIADVTLRLHPIPEAIAACVCAFDGVEGAVDAVIETIQLAIPVARIELLDAISVRASNAYAKLDLPEKPMLLLEFHGTEATVEDDLRRFKDIAESHGASGLERARSNEERGRLWEVRHKAYYAALAMRPGAKGMPTDACVPISALAQCIAETRADLDHSTLLAPIIGHVGDGNFHMLLLMNPDDPAELAEAERLNARLMERTIRLQGTITGEHGIGYGKIKYLAQEHGADGVALMAQIKHALDPRGLFNPGKIVPDA